MSKVIKGRRTAEVGPDGVVVFLIGMRFNHWWRVDKWWSVFTAMPRMLRGLSRQDDSPLLGYHLWFGPGRNLMVQQYWRSLDELIAYASDSAAPHAAAWRSFNRRIGEDGSVGIWHESYHVEPGRLEVLYGNMPAFGLAGATDSVEVTERRSTARRRLRQDAA
jgi:hypothetical protein